MISNKLKIHKSHWENSKVLVTGHTGFMGSWLCLLLKKLGCHVTGISLNPYTTPNLYSSIDSEIDESLILDIRNFEGMENIFKNRQFDYAFHLAAQPLVRLSYDTPIETFAANVMGTVNILEMISRYQKPKAVLVVTSDKCYKNNEQGLAFKEEDPLGGHDPYSASKAAAEIVVESYRKSFFEKKKIPLSSVRAGNIIGGGDWSDSRLVPDLMRNLISGNSVEIRSPLSVRPWQHVLEPIFVYVGLMHSMTENHDFARSWNIGPDLKSCRNVQELSNLVCQYLGNGAEKWLQIKNQNLNHLHEAQFLQIDSQRLRTTFNWHPILSFEKTIEWTVTWYKSYAKGENGKFLCQKQIKDFMELSANCFDYMV